MKLNKISKILILLIVVTTLFIVSIFLNKKESATKNKEILTNKVTEKEKQVELKQAPNKVIIKEVGNQILVSNNEVEEVSLNNQLDVSFKVNKNRQIAPKSNINQDDINLPSVKVD